MRVSRPYAGAWIETMNKGCDWKGRNVPPELLREAIEAFVHDENVLGRLGTQLIRLRVGEKKVGTLCGYANLKNCYGAFEGFGLFFFD